MTDEAPYELINEQMQVVVVPRARLWEFCATLAQNAPSTPAMCQHHSTERWQNLATTKWISNGKELLPIVGGSVAAFLQLHSSKADINCMHCAVLCRLLNAQWDIQHALNGSKQSVKSNGYKGWRWVSAPPDPVSYLGRKSLTSNSRVAEKRCFRCACISHREQKLWDDCRDETCGPRRFCDGGHMSHTCGPESP